MSKWDILLSPKGDVKEYEGIYKFSKKELSFFLTLTFSSPLFLVTGYIFTFLFLNQNSNFFYYKIIPMFIIFLFSGLSIGSFKGFRFNQLRKKNGENIFYGVSYSDARAFNWEDGGGYNFGQLIIGLCAITNTFILSLGVIKLIDKL